MSATGFAWLVAGAVSGFGFGTLLVYVVAGRPLRRERDEWQRKTRVLLAALRPFAPVKVRKVRTFVPVGHRWYYWACGSCASPSGLLGGPGGDDRTLAATNDDAREHYLDEHLTRENVERAGRAMAFALDSDRWWTR